MADLHTLISNVNGGEMSPQMEARVDSEKYQTGARILENFLIKPYGAISKRPGTEYLGPTFNNGPARLEGFRRSVSQNYMLEFNHQNISVWNTGTSAGRLELDPAKADRYQWIQHFNGSPYAVGARTFSLSDNKFYVCRVAHTSSSTTTPGSGADWSQYWDYFKYTRGTIVASESSPGVWRFWRCIKDQDIFIIDGVSDPEYWIELTGGEMNISVMDIPSPYQASEIFDIQMVQLNDVMFLAHPNHYPRRLSRFSENDWRLDEVPFQYAPALDVNETTDSLQVQYDIAFWVASTSYIVGSRVLNSDGTLYTCHTAHTSSSSGSAAMGEPGITSGTWANYWNAGSSKENIPTWSATAYTVGQKIRRGKNIYVCKRNHTGSAPTINTSGGGVAGNRPQDGKNWALYWTLSDAGTDLKDVPFKLVSSGTSTFVASDVGSSWQLTIGSDNYYAFIPLTGTAGTIQETDAFFIQGSYIASTNWNSGNAYIGTLTLEESSDGVNWSILKQWVTTDATDSNISFTGESPTTGAWYRLSGIKVSGGQKRFKIEPGSSVLTLPVKITEYVNSTEVKAIIVMPNDQLPPEAVVGQSTSVYKKPAFGPTTGYPRTVTYHEARIWWGGIVTEPARLWGSQKEDFYIYLTGTNDIDALDITLGATSTNKILWIKSYNRSLIVGTEGEIFTVDSGETDTSMNATNIRARLRLNYGACNIPANITGDSLLFIQRGEKRVREFAYRFESDSFAAPDMTLLAEHINQDGFIQTAYQSNLEPILWTVTNKGALAAFSYDREQKITAWARHITGNRADFYANNNPDMFTSIGIVYGGTRLPDEIWMTVKRYVGGEYKYYLERFSPKMMEFIYGGSWKDVADSDMWQFFDCYRRTTNGNRVETTEFGFDVTTYSGFDYLEGRDVYIIADKGIVPDAGAFTVSGGKITLFGHDTPDNLTVGIPIYSVYASPRLEVVLENGTSQGRATRINRASFKLWRSYGGKYQVYDSQFNNAQVGEAIEAYPVQGSSLESIEYNDFNYSLSIDRPNKPTPEYEPAYTGQTTDQHVNSNPSVNTILAVVADEPKPFNMLGMVLKMEVTGN